MQFRKTSDELARNAPYISNADVKHVPITLPYTDPANEHARHFECQVRGILDGHIKDSLPEDKLDVLILLCGLRYVPSCSIGNGISWLELLVIFLVHAKQTYESTTAKAGASLCKRLRVFTSHVRSVVN